MAEVISIRDGFNESSPGRLEIKRDNDGEYENLRLKPWNILRMTIHEIPLHQKLYINGVEVPRQEEGAVSVLNSEDGNWKVPFCGFISDVG